MKKTMVYKKNIVLGVCGGIAVYKVVDLLRKLIKFGAKVKVIMTKNAVKFVGPITFETLSHNNVVLDFFEESNSAAVSHIDLSSFADIVILAPATANIIGKIANGIADDALSTFMLAVTSPVIVCPSMNSDMYENPAMQMNLNKLNRYGYKILFPGEGELACGISGLGRLLEPYQIIDRLNSYLTPKKMIGKNILITAGPTQEMIDPVRFISNQSSGKMGYAIARIAENRGANVILISGPVAIDVPINVRVIYVKSAFEMYNEVFKILDDIDIIIKVAAVSDYRPSVVSTDKMKKKRKILSLNFNKNLDILKEIGRRKKSNQIVVGFAAETCNIILNAKKKLETKNLDLIVGNIVGSSNFGFSSDKNHTILFFRDGKIEDLGVIDKDLVANILLDRIIEI